MSHMSLEEHFQNLLSLSRGEHPIEEVLAYDPIDYSRIDIDIAQEFYGD